MSLTHMEVTEPDERTLPPACMEARSVLARVGDKWTVLIVIGLASGPKRFSALKRDIPGISQRMLTLTLRTLQRDGMVSRTMFPTIPPRVDYALTDLGHSLRQPLEALGQWVFANLPSIDAARRDFDAEAAALG